MIDGLKLYPAYKDSGVPWLGAMPEHWEIRKLRNVLGRVTERNRPDLPLLSVVREKGVILRDVTNKDENRNFIPDDLSNYKVVRSGQFAMNKMKAWQGSYGVSRHDGIVSPAYFIFDIDEVEGTYFHSAIRSKAYVPFFTQASDGVRIGQWDLSQARMKEIPFFIPPLREQSAIVRFLDHADRRIRRYIRAKQKLIKLLEEQKQVIIHCAVTRGLDPNVRLKPSGVEWLGNVPEQWEVLPMRHLLSFGPKNGVSPPASNVGGVLSFSISAVRDGRIRVAGNEKYVDLDTSLVPGFRICKGDILLVRGNGNLALVAKCGLVDECPDNCIYPDILMKLRPNARMVPDFMVLAINSPYVSNQVPLLARTTNGTFKVSGASVRSFVLAVPPRSEQETILEHLSRVLADVDRARERAGSEISLLREYCIRLIADVVTGKLDVRDAAARLPDEVEEAESLDDADTPAEGDEEAESADFDAAAQEAEA